MENARGLSVERGVKVSSWYIPRELNEVADRCVKYAGREQFAVPSSGVTPVLVDPGQI